ncbi:hypothetical protein JCM10212_002422 [Sporobolomyces blumeae]
MRRLISLWLVLGATLALAASQGRVSVRPAPTSPFDLATRFLETIHHEKPDAFYPFLRLLQKYELRPKTVFEHAAFKSSANLDGSPRPSKYANHNPVFTRLARPAEAYQALESTFLRSRLWKERGTQTILKLALASDAAVPTLEEMNRIAIEREQELSTDATGGSSKTCQSWVDVAGTRACSSDDFWKTVGVNQIFAKTPIDIKEDAPALYEFDRLLPPTRSEKLPLVVLYASPTDEAFPALFDLVYNLAKPAWGQPRLQFALRWKANSDSDTEYPLQRFDATASVVSGVETGPHASDLSTLAVSRIAAAEDQLAALVDVTSSLPLSVADLAQDLAPSELLALCDSTKDTDFVSINGVRVLTETTFDARDLLNAIRVDGRLLHSLSSIIYADDKLAHAILTEASTLFTLEEPKKGAKGPVLPTEEQPLEFVNLVEAMAGLPPVLTRRSFIEGATNDDGDVDPPALASFLIVTDLESKQGREFVQQALRFLENNSELRLAFLHRSTTPPADRYAFSSLLYTLAESNDLAQVYPSELREFLELEMGPNGPKRSLTDDAWNAENPMSPFVNAGLSEDDRDGLEHYLKDTRTLLDRLNISSQENAVVVNGRVIRLGDKIMTAPTLANLHRYELKRRIQPVVNAAVPALTDRIKQDRLLQAELFDQAVSVLGSTAPTKREPSPSLAAGIPTISIGNTSVHIMFDVVAVVDPVSRFARAAVPILASLATNDLFRLQIHLAPTSNVPSEQELRAFRSSAFPLGLTFDDETAEIVPSVATLSNRLPKGTVVDVDVTVDGRTVGEKEGMVVEGGEQVVVLERPETGAAVDGQKVHVRDEL